MAEPPRFAGARTARVPRDDGTCGWVALAPPRHPPRRLEGDVEADWAILGAGYTGLAAARRLAEHEPSARVVIVDAQRAGESASGRNSGFAVDLSTSRAGTDSEDLAIYRRKRRLNMAAIDLLRQVVADHGVDCQWREVGKFHCAADPANEPEVDAIRSLCERLDLDHQALDAPELAARLGTAWYRRGVYTPDAVLVQPAALARGLARSLPGNHVSLYEESPVLSIAAGDPCRVITRGGSVRARNLILAANGFLPDLGLLRRRILPMTLTASLTRPLDAGERAAIGDPADWGVLAAHGMGATVRYTRDHRIFMRNTAEYWPRRFMTPAELAARRRIHLEAIRARFPDLGAVGIDYTWAGVVGMTRNLMPFFGRLAHNVFASAAYNGSGITGGTIGGTLIVDLALGHDSQLLRERMAFPAPAWMPPRPLLDVGARWRIARASRGLGRDL